MKLITVAVLALAEIGMGQATGERVTARQLLQAPKDYIGKTIVIPDIPCVDNPKGGFLCVTIVDGQALRIEASSLGAKTKIEIAERLTQGCKGTANLTRSVCRVDAEIEPKNAYKDIMDTENGSMPIAGIYSGAIEMYSPKRSSRR